MDEGKVIQLFNGLRKGIQITCQSPNTPFVNSFVSERLDLALEFILKNKNQRISIEEIAAEAALSKFHLIRSFKTQFGITPFKLHLELKIDNAKKMLIKNPRLKIKDIALLIGYSDIFAFSKHFKKTTGYSPKAYQAKYTSWICIGNRSNFNTRRPPDR